MQTCGKWHKEAIGEPDAGEPKHETGPEVPSTELPLAPHCSIASQCLHWSALPQAGDNHKWVQRKKIDMTTAHWTWQKVVNVLPKNITCSRWMPLTRAALDTTGFLSTTACFRYRSICPSNPPSVILQSTLIAFARYKSVLLFMSFIRELVTMITCQNSAQISWTLNHYQLMQKAMHATGAIGHKWIPHHSMVRFLWSPNKPCAVSQCPWTGTAWWQKRKPLWPPSDEKEKT